MAFEGLTLNPGVGGSKLFGDTSGTDGFAQAVKLIVGGDGTFNVVEAASGKTLPITLYTAAGVATGVSAAPLQISLANHAANAIAVKVDNSAVTQPVSNAGTFNVQVTSIAAGTNAIGKLAANSGVDIGDVDVTSLIPGVAATSLGKAEDAAHVSGDTGVAVWAVRSDTASAKGADGDYAPFLVDASGRLHVVVGGAVLPTDASSATNQLTQIGIANNSDTLISSINTILSGVAHDAADAGNPHKIGAKATTSLSSNASVANNDRTDVRAGADGILIVRPNTNLEDIVQDTSANTNGTSTAFTGGLGSPGASVRLYIKTVTISNSSSSFGTVDLRDGAAGSVLWTLPVPATGGIVQTFDPPLRLSANTPLAYDPSGAITTLNISANGFKSRI